MEYMILCNESAEVNTSLCTHDFRYNSWIS
jgi:hypothetical protein